MKKILQSSLLLLFVTLVLTSCKNNVPKEAKYIPKDASFVMILDPEQMQDKLQKGGISIDTLIGRIFKHDSPDSKDRADFNKMRDSAGVNWSNKLFLFMQQKTNPDKSQSNVISLVGGLKDAAKFEAFLKNEEHHKGKEIKKEKDYSYLAAGNDNTMLAWNDEQIIVTMYTHTQKAVYDTVAMTFRKPDPANTEAEMKREVDHYFTQKVSESLADLKIFTDMFKEKADGYMFTNSNASVAALSNMMPLQIPKLEEMLKDNYSTATLSFEDGKIVAKSTSHFNKLLAGVMKQYSGPTVDLSMIENYPSQNINGFMLVAVNPEIVGGMLKQLEVEGLVNNFLEKGGLSSQDLYKSLKGNISVIVSDLGMPDFGPEPQMKHDEKSMMKKKSFGKMIVNAPIGDKASFTKLMDKAVAQGFLVKANNTYKAGGLLASLGLFVNADDKNLIIASDSVTYVQYMAKTSKAIINKELLDGFKGKTSAFYFDIAGTLNGFIKDSTGGSGFSNSLINAKKTFKDVIGSTDNFDGSSMKASFELRMQNEKQNSLVTLTSLLTDIAVDMRVQAKKEKEMEEKLFPGGIPAIIRTN
jgi:hypothetical protein